MSKYMLGLAAAAMVAACAPTAPREAHQIAQPQRLPERNVTGFTEALHCMDELFSRFNSEQLIITSQGIPDATGKISAGTKEMLISAVARMSVKSNAIRFVDFDQLASPDINTLQGLVGFTDDFRVPEFYLRGAITQLDENVLSDSASAALAVPNFDLGASADQIVSIVSVDMNVGDILSRQILPGMSATNAMAVRRIGAGADLGGEVQSFGVFLSVSFNRSEGVHAAVRSLVELSAIETLGKLTRVPYWRCLSVEETNPAVVTEIRNWYAGQDDSERVRFAQDALRELRYYQGATNGLMDGPTREAIGSYQASRGLLASGRVNYDLYAALLNDRMEMPMPAVAALPPASPRPIPTPVATQPQLAALGLGLRSNRADNIFTAGETLSLYLRPSRDAFGYCYYQDDSGTVARIYPNRFQPNALIAGGLEFQVPDRAAPFEITLDVAGGQENILCMASENELGLRLPASLQIEDLSPLPVSSLDEIRQAFERISPTPVTSANLTLRVR